MKDEMKEILKNIVIFFLTLEAKIVLKRHKPKIVAITGTVGKTSTKDAAGVALSAFHSVRQSYKSFNSDLGIPLTILNLPNGWNNPFVWAKNIILGFWIALFSRNYPEWLILEIGAEKPGDVERPARWIKPDVVILTRLAKVPVHVEFFASPEEVWREKRFLVEALKPQGLLVYNQDDEDVASMAQMCQRRTSFGVEEQADITLRESSVLYEKTNVHTKPKGMALKVAYRDISFPINMKRTVGDGQIYPVLAAFALATALGFDPASVSKALSGYRAPRGRMRIISGIKDSVIIDDTYNSSPVALNRSLNTLGKIESRGKKIAILGDMKELGDFSEAEHKIAGEYAAKFADLIILVGQEARFLAEGALIGGMHESKILQFENAREAGKKAEHLIEEGDVVLVKGSQSVRMEKAVEEIMLEPNKKERLLVRQESEWYSRQNRLSA